MFDAFFFGNEIEVLELERKLPSARVRVLAKDSVEAVIWRQVD